MATLRRLCYDSYMHPFEQTITIHFRQTDMAGIAYFNEAFNIFHDVYEKWVVHYFGSCEGWFAHPQWAVPLKHVECDYHAPLLPFQNYTVHLVVGDISQKTFQLRTEILNSQHTCATVTTTHIFMDKKSQKAIALPEDVRIQLSSLL